MGWEVFEGKSFQIIDSAPSLSWKLLKVGGKIDPRSLIVNKKNSIPVQKKP
jgi:hypothetical protein